MIDDGIAAILRRDHHWSGNFLQDGGEEIYRNGTEGSNPAYSGGESCELQPVSRGAHRAKRRTNLRSTVYCKARLMALRMPLIAAQNSASTAAGAAGRSVRALRFAIEMSYLAPHPTPSQCDTSIGRL